ncbi:threonyl-tRNA synthetase [Caldicellulosiruptor saccharolyticus DSM 8903]|uniref:Threonine--tRNA ligase n=1 Tax=Caldicellulosiruptor saccharolyticus (strain ATCC 43494 / DSM 8903 / Tp8T 6331) TaxID=351627 RepID=A4XI26_CALS8|nr:threonine--tRNA ligase [Caldicellulosiruptor saccharolyticus]ABP66561.1 threonyl-tRNA synthetase [Caldicellulosiruptor saccharolyticus DSM 8903]
MEKVNVTLPDGKIIEVEKSTSALDLVKSISMKLYKEAVACKINGILKDLWTPIDDDCSFEVVTFASDEGKRVYWHTTSHILAQSVKRLFGDKVKLGIGPAIDNGFYYDFDVEESITKELLEKIEEEMQKIIKEDLKIERFELSREEAKKLMQQRGENYKVELINDIPEGEIISFYRQGEFVDLCTGPHLPSTGRVKAFKLLSVAGAYWRGNSKNKMLQRVYGISYEKKSQLDEYLTMLEEAKRRDHRKLGRELDLFDIFEQGPGFPFFLPKGMIIRNILEDFWREEHKKRGYQEIKTPIMLTKDLWVQSGHWDHYKENMYFTKIDDQEFAIKPMNCPGSILVYKRKSHSYRELPERLCELGLVHRHELSGVLHGLMRVRCFTQDDAHIFMLPSQIKDEIKGVIDLIDYFYSVFGFKYHVELSTRPENSMGTDEQWNMAETALKEALEEVGINYKINEGDGAFYGPKIDFHLEDSLKRTWQCATIQLDFQMPERFDLYYIGEDGAKHRPVMLHRVVFGSIERFIAILTEHFAGAFPVWLAPIQIRVIPVSDNFNDYAAKISQTLKENGFRVEEDFRSETVGYKIRDAQLQKIPYMVIVGEKERRENTIAVRDRKKGDLGSFTIDKFVSMVKEKVEKKVIE